MNPPKMPIHIGDYKRDTGHLRAMEHGAYLLLMFHYWSTGGLPDNDDHLATIARLSRSEWKKIKPTIQAFFKEGWKHGRIDYDLEKARNISEAAREAGKASGRSRSVKQPLNGRSPSVEPTIEPLNHSKKESCPDGKPSRTKLEYSEEFEAKFWGPYPRSPTMSKKEAWREWMKLAPEQRAAACQAIDPYRRFLRTKPNLETVHACRFLSQRRFEGFSEQLGTPSQPSFDIRSSLV